MGENEPEPEQAEPERANGVQLRDVYNAAQTARQAWRTLAWQVPALALAAEAVLVAVIASNETSDWGRLLASVVAWVSVSVALQLFLRHGYLADLTETWLAQEEERLGLPVVSDRRKLKDQLKDKGKEVDVRFRRLAERPSRPIWTWVLLVLSLADVLLIADAVSELAVHESVLGT